MSEPMTKSRSKLTLLAGTLASSIFLSGMWAQSTVSAGVGTTDQSAPAAAAPGGAPLRPAGTPFRNQPVHMERRAVAYYGAVWGVDSFSVKLVESGEIVRFMYHVVDADRAKALNDKKVEPVLIAPERGVKLVVPSFEKVGQLRQTSTPEAGRSYWMAFSNAGRPVKRGDRVNVAIGNFHVENLIVE
jgi:hypothetical protein